MSSRSSKAVLMSGIALTLLFVGGGLVKRDPLSNATPVFRYHASAWNRFLPDIDRSATDKPRTLSSLSHVHGMVLPHHIPQTIPKLNEMYQILHAHQSVSTFIIVAPDHTDSGVMPVSVSAAPFVTDYGQTSPIPDVVPELLMHDFVSVDESVFEHEHSIGSQILFITKYFPNAKVLPIVMRSDTPIVDALKVGATLASFVDDETVIVASVDFSHYLPADQARHLDAQSAAVLEELDVHSLNLVTADSHAAVAAFMSAMRSLGSVNTENITVMNTNDFMQNDDYTTGYIFGFWGK